MTALLQGATAWCRKALTCSMWRFIAATPKERLLVRAVACLPSQLTSVLSRMQIESLRKRMQKLANALGIDHGVEAEAHTLVEQVLSSWSSHSRMPRAALLVAACLFIVSRLHEVPLTIINVALEAQVSI